MNYDPIDTDAQKKRKDQTDLTRKLTRDQELDDIKWLMSQKQGRRVMHRLLTITGIYRSSFTGNSQTFFNEGQRNIGLILTADVHQHCSNDFVLMLNENKEDPKDPS